MIHHLESETLFGMPNWHGDKRLPPDEVYDKYHVEETTFNDLVIQESGQLRSSFAA